MAEYIDKVQAMNIIAEGKNDKPYFGTTEKDWEVIDFLKTVPTADVVEREKVDKAIDEIEEYKRRQLALATGVEDLEQGKQVALDYVIAILNKLIESEE